MEQINLKRDYSRLTEFLNERQNDIGVTLVNELHTKVSQDVIKNLLPSHGLKFGQKILDVGCGAGGDLIEFTLLGCEATGLTLYNDEILQQTIKSYPSIQIVEGDQTFPPIEPGKFDLVFARHVLEHSLIPYLTLCEYNRLLKLKGLCYVEVPFPDQPANHEVNHNHYSVLGIKLWNILFNRSGFRILFDRVLNIADNNGAVQDKWYQAILCKEQEPFKGWHAKSFTDPIPWMIYAK